jgi:ribosomal protein S18 acetylase RimI-like enzyme
MVLINDTTKLQFDEIMKWLHQESEESGEGFYCNKEIIFNAFRASEMCSIVLNGFPIGFGIFNIKSIGCSIDILEIHPLYRGNGLGTQMAEYLLAHLFNLNVSYITVKCSPKSSEKFWRKLGFIDFPSKSGNLRLPLELKLTAEQFFRSMEKT